MRGVCRQLIEIRVSRGALVVLFTLLRRAAEREHAGGRFVLINAFRVLTEVVDDVKPWCLKDVGGTVLGEIRAGCGQYSVVSGRYPRRDDAEKTESIRFANDRDPIGFDATGLHERVRLLGVAALLSRHFPGAQRHNATLAIAGTLANLGVDAEDTRRVLEAVTFVADGEVWADAASSTRATYQAKQDGKPYTAATELAELLGTNGKAVVKLIHKWFGADARKPVIAGAESYSDAGSAEFFARTQGDRLRFDERQARWLQLNGVGVWAPVTEAALIPVAIAATRERQRLAVDVTDRALRDQAFRWIRSSESRGALANILALSRGLPPLRDDGDAWDAIPHLLGTPNGVVDLRTGVLRPASPDERITLQTSIEYDPAARSALWEHTLDEVFPHEGLAAFFQAVCGYWSTGENNLDKWFMCEGPSGRNGKGTIVGAVLAALGEYCAELPASIFDQRQTGTPFDLAKLPCKRVVTSSEAGDTIKIHHDRLKQLTGGDKLRAADKNQRSFEFYPIAKPIMSCNSLPKVRDESQAFWARTIVIPFTVSFHGRENVGLRDLLRKDPSHQRGILAWVVRGAMRYYAQGRSLGPPPACVTSASDRFRDVSAKLHDFYEARCEILPGAKVKASELFNEYREWARHNTSYPFGSKSFYQEVEKRFAKQAARDANFYLGLGLREHRGDLVDRGLDF